MAKTLENGRTGFRAAELVGPLNVSSYKESHKISSALGDHAKAGRLVKIETGLYRLPSVAEIVAKTVGGALVSPMVKDKMWSILRSRGTVTVADLQELAGAKASYAQEWLRMLIKREIVKGLPQSGNQQWKYQLVKRHLVAAPGLPGPQPGAV